jgi:hypothetical protein
MSASRGGARLNRWGEKAVISLLGEDGSGEIRATCAARAASSNLASSTEQKCRRNKIGGIFPGAQTLHVVDTKDISHSNPRYPPLHFNHCTPHSSPRHLQLIFQSPRSVARLIE